MIASKAKKGLKVKYFFNRYMVVVFAIAICLSMPLIVSIDGYNFLDSARSLFSSDAADSYSWYREPGYPAFIKFFHGVFGNADIWITLPQGIAMIGALGILWYVLAEHFSRVQRLVGGTVITIGVLNPVYLSYSSMVLRQAYLTFVIAGFCGLVAKSYKETSLRGQLKVVTWAVALVLVGVSLSAVIAYVAVVPFLILLVNLTRISLAIDRSRQRVRATLAVPLVVITLFITLGGSWVAWDSYKTSQENGAPRGGGTNFQLNDALQDAFNHGLIGFSEQFLSKARITLMLVPSDNSGAILENELWTGWQTNPDNRCGAWDGLPQEIVAKARAYVTSTCRSAFGQRVTKLLREPGLTVYRFVSLAFLIFPLYLALRRRWTHLAIIATPLWFLILHSSRNYSNDRYGIPLYPIGLVGLATFVSDAAGRLQLQWVSWRSKDEVNSV